MQPETVSQPQSAATSAAETQSPPRLRRVLGLGDLIFYGIVLIQPVGAVGIFGLADQKSFGHVTLTILIALAAMMLTAWSYGRMAGLYPAAGSAYTYVGRGLNPHAGFLAGWAMFLDYLVIPIVSVIYGAISVQKVVDALAPGFVHRLVGGFGLPVSDQRLAIIFWVLLFASFTTLLNVRGIKWTAGANQVLTAVMFLVIAIFLIDAVRFLFLKQGWAGLFSTEPFYNPRTFNLRTIGTATSLAALTYIGFDGITTLSEDVNDPKRTVPIAVVLVCLLIGICVGAQVYLAQRAWPDYTTFTDPDTAFFDVCGLVGGKFLLNTMALTLAVACLGSALTGQVGAARILFGMGRDGALPKFFARLDRKSNPVLNIWLIGIVALLGALLLNYEKAATLINFGAFLAFMGVNLAVVREFFFRPPAGHRRNWFLDLLAPVVSFVFCLLIWLSLPLPAKVLGGAWCAAGLLFLTVRICGFRFIFSVDGRAGRETFWLVSVTVVVASLVVERFAEALISSGVELRTPERFVWFGAGYALFFAWLPVALWMFLAVQAKRWHDRNKSGWMVLLNLIPAIGTIWTLIELGFLEGSRGVNRYGDKAFEGIRQPVMLDLSGA